jgi:hypothetical protein
VGAVIGSIDTPTPPYINTANADRCLLVPIADAAKAQMRLDVGANILFLGFAPTPAIRVVAIGWGLDTGVVATHFFGEQP